MEDKLKIIEHNISLLTDKRVNIEELIREMFREVGVSAFSSNENSSVDDAVRIFESICAKTLSDTTMFEFALYSTAITQSCGDKFGKFPISQSTDYSFASIAYMQNSYSDAAYRKFASRFKKASAIYFPGFREVCEEVYYGRSTHAIIPIYTSKDGQLLSFRKLIAKYELKCIYECSVEMNDETVMRFALLQKGLSKPEGNLRLDLSVILPDKIRSGDFLWAIEALGGQISMINSNPLEYSDDKYNLDILIDVSDTDMNALYLFLEGTHISYDIVGLYSVIDDYN